MENRRDSTNNIPHPPDYYEVEFRSAHDGPTVQCVVASSVVEASIRVRKLKIQLGRLGHVGGSGFRKLGGNN